MSLIEQRNLYAQKLQKLVDERKAKIDEAVAKYRAELEANAQVTPEMQKLTGFVRQLDEIIAYEAAQQQDNSVAESPVVAEPVFCNAREDNTAEQAEAKAEGLAGTGFEALAADAMATRQRLEAVEQGRPGMPNVVLPDRQ